MTASGEAVRVAPRLHLVTDERILRRADFPATAGSLLHAGGPRVALHLRAPGLSGRECFGIARRLGAIARATGAMLLVNDRIDIALAASADGVQLGSGSIPAGAARRLVGPAGWIGVSVHGAAEARAALEDGADFVMAGTLFETASHPGRAGQGVEWLSAIPGATERVIGIGGISLDRVATVAARAHGVAVIRAVWDAPRPVDALNAFLHALHERVGE